MKKAVLITLFVLALAYLVFGQCGYDSICSPIVMDTANIGNIQPRCTQCPADGCVAWELPDNFDGHFFLNSPNNALFSVQITTFCDYMIWDTCAILPPSGMAGMALVVEFSVIGNSQVVVCGAEGNDVEILVKTTTSHQEELSEILLDLTTCQIPTGIEEPKPTQQFKYFDPITMIEVTEFKPNGAYLQRKR